MTRKKFVKLLMSYGYGKDEAETEAVKVQSFARPWSYAKQYSYMKKSWILWARKTGNAFRIAIKKINRNTYTATRALAESTALRVNGRKNNCDTEKI